MADERDSDLSVRTSCSSAGPLKQRYICRLRTSGGPSLVTSVYAESPRIALRRLAVIDLSPLASGRIDILNDEGDVLLTRAWPLDLAGDGDANGRS